MGVGMGLCAAKKINKVDNLQDDLFAFKINYNDADTATDLFNGNISETYWKTSTDNVLRKYDYKYDDLNRLLQADYSKQGNTAFNSYLEHLSYDKNGNIQKLLRNGSMDTDGYQFANPIDNLTYLYDTDNQNQLLRVFDATANPQGFKDDPNGTSLITEKAQAPDYGYDANGNMTKDDNKGIKTISYNHLNLPTKITFANPNNITYLYNAVGQKLGKVVTELVVAQTVVVKTDYLSGFQYVNDVMQFFPHAEGYVKVTGTSYDYVYNYTDHLGNIRLSYSKDITTNALKVIEENHYYPFGLKHTGYNSDKYYIAPRPGRPGSGYYDYSEIEILPYNPANFNASLNYDYKYNGKEYQDELGLNMTAMDYRQYDSAIGRFNGMDKLAEMSHNITPYRFAFNNPNFWSDPSGLFETRKEARQYRRENNIQGRIQKNREGGYDINNYEKNINYSSGNDKGFSNDSNPNDKVIESALVTKEKSSFGGKDLYDASGTGLGFLENITWKGMSTAAKSKFAWDNANRLALLGLKGSTSALYKTKIPGTLKGVGIGMGVISLGFTGADIVSTGQLKASHILDATMTGIGFIPGGGWIAGAVYFGADIITKGLTGKSIGNHLDEYVEEKFDKDNGALINIYKK